MTWDTLNFTEFTTPPSIPGTAVHSLSITNITDLQAAIQDTSVDVVNWDGIYSDNTVIVDQLANIAVDKTLYITGTGDLPPLKIINGSADRSLVIMDMTFGGDQPAGNRRINMINAENVTLYNLDRSWQGQANNFIVMGNTRGQVTRNIKIHRGRWIGTQSSPNELAAVLYASDCPTLDRDDYNANGAWPGEFDGIEIYDVHSTEVSDFVQLQMTDGNVRHYTDKDYKNLHVKGCLIESPAGLSEDAFDVKGTSKLWENRAIIEHCIMRGYRAVSGGGTGANGAAISGHTTNCKVEIKDTIVHDCSQGFAVSSRGGRYDLSGVRFSDITGYCIIALTGTDKTNVVDIDQCLFDNVGKLCSSLWDGAHTPVTITNSVFRNITSSEQSTGFSGAGNEWDVAIPNLAGNVRTFTAATDLSVHGTNIEQFRGYDSLHPWHPDSTQTSAPNHFILPLDFEVHTFDTGREINTVGQRIISTPGSHGLPRANGHFRFLGNLTGPTRYALLEDNLRSWISDYPYNTSSGTGFRGFKIRTRWKNIEKTEGNINGGDVAYLESLYQICDDAGVYLMNNLLDISFGGSDYTDSHAPQYIEDGGGTDIKYFSDESQRQSGGTTAHVMLYVAQWMDKYIAMLKNYHDHFNKYNSYLGIEMPETSRSSQKTPGGNISAAFYDQYSRCLEEVGAHFMTGPKNAYLNAHINFQVAGGHDYVEDYFPRFVNQAGIEIGTPDFNWAWYIKNPNHASKTIKAYDLMRQYGDRMLIAPSRETRDSPLDPVDDFKMMFDIGANSIRPHRVYHYTEWWVVKGSSPADIRTAEYRRNVLNLLEQSDWKYNHDVPSNEAGGASTYEGKNPTYTDVGFTGTALNLKNRTNATASVTDEFTVEFKDALDVDETQTVEFSELPAVQGTQTDKAFSYVSLNSSHITENGTPSWLPDTTVGYTGTHALRADGDNKTSGATTYENGDFIRIDASQLVGVNRLYMRVKSTDGTNNEWWAKFQAGSIPWGSDQYIPPALRGDYIWKELLDPLDNSTTRTVSASDGYIDLYVREDGLLLDGYVFVHESETSAPTGLEGYISNNVEQNSTIIGDTDYNLQKGQSVNVKWELSVEQGSEYDSIAVDTIDQNGTVVPFTSNVVTTSLGGNKFRISADITGHEIGSYRARLIAIVNGFELIDIVQVWVEEVSQSNFPSGITVDMDTEKTVAVGSTYTIDTQIQNTPNYNISMSWTVTGALELLLSTETTVQLNATTVGSGVVTYRVTNNDGVNSFEEYKQFVTVVAATIITDDTYKISADTTNNELDVLANDAQNKIEGFTQPANGNVIFSNDRSKLLYTPDAAYTGSDEFQYTANNGDGIDVGTATVLIDVIDPDSFDGSVVATIGDGKIGTAGDSLRYELQILQNPHNYSYDPNWSVDIDASIITQFKLSHDKHVLALQLSRPLYNSDDIDGTVTCTLSQVI